MEYQIEKVFPCRLWPTVQAVGFFGCLVCTGVKKPAIFKAGFLTSYFLFFVLGRKTLGPDFHRDDGSKVNGEGLQGASVFR